MQISTFFVIFFSNILFFGMNESNPFSRSVYVWHLEERVQYYIRVLKLVRISRTFIIFKIDHSKCCQFMQLFIKLEIMHSDLHYHVKIRLKPMSCSTVWLNLKLLNFTHFKCSQKIKNNITLASININVLIIDILELFFRGVCIKSWLTAVITIFDTFFVFDLM